ncbi:MAG TPA: hypothetical protein VFB07_01785 [Vicinamibacterales bacterium]|nr:hypothetical protein [Vicinamibacterales bacterium]
MSDSSAGAPLAGDVVVRRTAAPEEHYLLSRYGAGDQFSFRSYDDAVAAARRFALREHVDVWYRADADSVVRVAAFRAPETAG